MIREYDRQASYSSGYSDPLQFSSMPSGSSIITYLVWQSELGK